MTGENATRPAVSVIMPCYNTAKFVGESIESVLKQGFDDWELLVVDDASDDGTASVVRDFAKQDARIKLTEKQQHSGIADTRNTALSKAQGRYVAFLDADDLWLPDKLERQLDFMTANDSGFCYTAYDLIDESGHELKKTIHTDGDLTYDAYLKNTIIGCSTVMLDRNKVGNISMPQFRTSEDMATWLDIMKKGFTANALDVALTYYRIRPMSASSNRFKSASDVWLVYRKQEQLYFFHALGCFWSYAIHAIRKRLS